MLKFEHTGKFAFTIWDARGVTAIHDCGHMCKWWVIDRLGNEKGGCCNCREYGMLNPMELAPKFVPCKVCINA